MKIGRIKKGDYGRININKHIKRQVGGLYCGKDKIWKCVSF